MILKKYTISLTGFDNRDLSSYADMRLTMVKRDAGNIAAVGTKILLTYIEEGLKPRDVWLNNHLIVRECVNNLTAITQTKRNKMQREENENGCN